MFWIGLQSQGPLLRAFREDSGFADRFAFLLSDDRREALAQLDTALAAREAALAEMEARLVAAGGPPDPHLAALEAERAALAAALTDRQAAEDTLARVDELTSLQMAVIERGLLELQNEEEELSALFDRGLVRPGQLSQLAQRRTELSASDTVVSELRAEITELRAEVARSAEIAKMAAGAAPAALDDPQRLVEAMRAFDGKLNEGRFGLYASEPMVQFDYATVGLVLSEDLQQPLAATQADALTAGRFVALIEEPQPIRWFAVMVAELVVSEGDFRLHGPARRVFLVDGDGVPEQVFWGLTPQRSGPLTLTLRIGVDKARFADQSVLPPPRDILRTVTVRAEPISASKLGQHLRNNWREVVNWIAAGLASALGAALAWVIARWTRRRLFPGPPPQPGDVEAGLGKSGSGTTGGA